MGSSSSSSEDEASLSSQSESALVGVGRRGLAGVATCRRCSTVIVKIACERLERLFMPAHAGRARALESRRPASSVMDLSVLVVGMLLQAPLQRAQESFSTW
jgi:hypothetical protein